jgi:hypothetical protein
MAILSNFLSYGLELVSRRKKLIEFSCLPLAQSLVDVSFSAVFFAIACVFTSWFICDLNFLVGDVFKSSFVIDFDFFVKFTRDDLIGLLTHFTSSSTDGCTYVSSSDSSSSSSDSFGSCWM